MTVPEERMRSILYMREFALSLLDPERTPRVPLAIRMEARARLRHFPGRFDVEQFCKAMGVALSCLPKEQSDG